ncbi:putative HAD-like hydrolase, purine nucleotidase [Nitrospira japonica]|uniref:Putative HAD-like hydrolase, purine nucleotidase n=1 Tax=Nitrospira japonica TaxID=1325564 RepID=A0A1W1I2J7_9BACT|nr:HAD-IA family hydrolase [Nitrospira japonica]SLM47043.1 putative HAD-like hydrolase, purine nucleotidase [Nitrospira japonica]
MDTLSSAEAPPRLDWSQIDDVLVDMDGTLLDRHFDNFFFEEELPRRYALRERLSLGESRARLMAMYRSVEDELAWTDLQYWTTRVGIDVVAMHRELDHMIGFLPGATAFLSAVRHHKKRLTVLTNAHPAGVAIKTAKTGLERQVDRIVDAFEVGYLKMRPQYWPACLELVGFDPAKALFIDDDERCLAAAKQFGIAHLLHSAKSSSQSPPAFSASFRSVEDLSSLLNGPEPAFR